MPGSQSTFLKIRPVPGYEILMKKNKQDKTPLQLAIEKGNIGLVYNHEGGNH